MSNRSTLRGLIALLAATVACNEETTVQIAGPGDGDFTGQTVEFEWRGQVMPGDEVRIKGVAGTIRATPTAEFEVEVRATSRGGRSDPADVRIEVVRHADGVTVCAVYPAPRDRPANACHADDDWTVNTRNHDVEVEFTIQVPAGVRFAAQNVVGEVEALDLGDDVTASSVTGDVRVETAGFANATTITGTVTALLGGADWEHEGFFTTVTGDVFVEIPAGTNATIKASVINGAIRSDFPLTDRGGGRQEGTIGSGGPDVTLAAVTGDIVLRRR